MTVSYIVFDNSSGEIVKTGSCQESDADLQAGAGQTSRVLKGDWNDVDHYYDGESFAQRPSFDLQPSALEFSAGQVFRVNNIPEGTEITYPGGSVTVDDGFIEWSTIEPGKYEFEFENFPYKPEVISAKVTAV